MSEVSDERLQYVRITNNLPFAFCDRFDGVPVKIEPGRSENIPPDMAFHFFGYTPGAKREQLLRHIAKRHGWNTKEFVERDPKTGKTKADEYFDKLDIKAVSYKLVPVDDSDPHKPIPADIESANSGEAVQSSDEPIVPEPEAPAKPRTTPKRVEVNVS